MSTVIIKRRVEGKCSQCRRELKHTEPVFDKRRPSPIPLGDTCPDCSFELLAKSAERAAA
jgi:hypothetical protein